MRDTRTGRRANGRRGAALVLVMIFGVAALMLVTTMLSLSRSAAMQEGAQHRQKELVAVLKAGIAAAVNEINTARSQQGSYSDPEGNGPGAMGCNATQRDGIAVTAPDGRVLGYFRSVVERDAVRTGYPAGADVLVVTAAWPSFTHPQRQVVAAEVFVAPQRLPFGSHPFEGTGEFDKAKKNFWSIAADANVNISAPDADVPAVNFTDPDLHESFVDEVIPELNTLEGADPNNPGTLVDGAATVTNDADPGIINQDSLEAIRAGINARVASAIATGKDLNDGLVPVSINGAPVANLNDVEDWFDDNDGTIDLGDGVFFVGDDERLDLDNGDTLKGSGTLVVTDEFIIENGGKLDWTGDIIVADNNKSKLSVAKDGIVRMKDGVLAVVSDDGSTKLDFKKDGDVVLGTEDDPVAVTLIAGTAKDETKLVMKKDLDFTLYGVLTVLASKKIEWTIDKDSGGQDSQIDIHGAVSLVMLDDGVSKTDLKITMKKGTTVNMTFTQDTVDGALENLGEFFDPTNTILPMKVSAYWERATDDVISQQEAVMDTVTPVSNWGMP